MYILDENRIGWETIIKQFDKITNLDLDNNIIEIFKDIIKNFKTENKIVDDLIITKELSNKND